MDSSKIMRHADRYLINRVECLRGRIDLLVKWMLCPASDVFTRIEQKRLASDIVEFAQELKSLVDKYSFLDYICESEAEAVEKAEEAEEGDDGEA